MEQMKNETTKGDVGLKWEKVKLDSICSMLSGNAWAAAKFKDTGKIPIIRIQNLGNNENEKFIYWDDNYDNKYIIHSGDLLLSLSGSIKIDTWKGEDALLNQRIVKLIPNKNIDNRWFFWQIKNIILDIEKMGKWALVNNVSIADLKEIQIPFPPLPIQQRIAEILDAADALRRKDEELLRKYDELAQAIFIDMFGDPVKNEKGWEVKEFSKMGRLDRGVSKHRPRNAPELLGGIYPLVQTGDVANSGGIINNYKSTYSEIGLSQSKLWEKGTLCITIAANIAKTGILNFDACFPDSVVGFIPYDNVTNTVYIQFWLSFLQKMLEETAPESAQKNINLEILRNLKVICPPFELQELFARKIKIIRQQNKILNNDISQNLFNSLLQQAFRGELIK